MRLAMYTLAPLTARACVAIKPIPEPAPVTRATRSVMSKSDLRSNSAREAAAELALLVDAILTLFLLFARTVADADLVASASGNDRGADDSS